MQKVQDLQGTTLCIVRAAAGVANDFIVSGFRVRQAAFCLGCLTIRTELSASLLCYKTTRRHVSMQQFTDGTTANNAML
jgi:hypothetical protein